jgi:hypothetical protein
MLLSRILSGASTAVLFTCLCFMLACKKPRESAQKIQNADRRAGLIEAFFGTPMQKGGNLNGFWSLSKSDIPRFKAEFYGDRTVPPVQSMPSPDYEAESGYFLRIEGKNCDELFFNSESDLTASAGTLKKLETTADRVAYSVVLNRRNLEGLRTNQGAVLTAFYSPKKLTLDFPRYRLTFNLAPESAEMLIKKYGVTRQKNN